MTRYYDHITYSAAKVKKTKTQTAPRRVACNNIRNDRESRRQTNDERRLRAVDDGVHRGLDSLRDCDVGDGVPPGDLSRSLINLCVTRGARRAASP